VCVYDVVVVRVCLCFVAMCKIGSRTMLSRELEVIGERESNVYLSSVMINK